MRLDLGSFPVRDIVFSNRTRWHDGVLEVDARALLEEVRADSRITVAELEGFFQALAKKLALGSFPC